MVDIGCIVGIRSVQCQFYSRGKKSMSVGRSGQMIFGLKKDVVRVSAGGSR